MNVDRSAEALESRSVAVTETVAETDVVTTAREDTFEQATTSHSEVKPGRVSWLDRWHGWQLRRLDVQLANERVTLVQREGEVNAQYQAVVAALQARDAAAARVG